DVKERHDQDEARGITGRMITRTAAYALNDQTRRERHQRLADGVVRRHRTLRLAGGPRSVKNGGVVIAAKLHQGHRCALHHDIYPVYDARRWRGRHVAARQNNWRLAASARLKDPPTAISVGNEDTHVGVRNGEVQLIGRPPRVE